MILKCNELKNRAELQRSWLGGAALLIAAMTPVSRGNADTVVGDLGAAGPVNYAILVGPKTTDFALNGPGTTNGNVGFDGSSQIQLNASNNAPVPNVAINGNLYLTTSASVNNNAQISGSVISNASSTATLNSGWSAAVTASATFAGLTANQTLSAINGPMTINATGAMNVIDIGSLNLGNGQTLTLNGSASQQFVINDSGNFTLNSGLIIETGGLTADDVVFNLTSSGNNLSTSGGLNNESVINGIVLDVNGGVAMAPGLINGELIAGGQTVHLVSGASINQVIPPPTAAPEIDPTSAASGLTLLMGGLVVLRGRKQQSIAA